jgi:hypothetical protein
MAVFLLAGGGVLGRPATPGADIASEAARRFPQPVRVGDLIERAVVEPGESRTLLGRVSQVIRLRGGGEAIVMKFGGFLGFGGRYIAVPVEAVALLGDEVVIDDLTPEKLRALPAYDPAGNLPLAPDSVIRIGVEREVH